MCVYVDVDCLTAFSDQKTNRNKKQRPKSRRKCVLYVGRIIAANEMPCRLWCHTVTHSGRIACGYLYIYTLHIVKFSVRIMFSVAVELRIIITVV